MHMQSRFSAVIKRALRNQEFRQWGKAIAYSLGVCWVMFGVSPAVAAQSMPWDSALCGIAQSLSGTTASAVAVIVLVVGGIMLAAGELGGVFKWAGGVMMGFSLMFGGVKVLQWFNVSYGC